ncbi:hypothetical protein RB195_011661 [Necator americanus]|uniref:Metalloendopeptidase n=2 Tax=Necator americanus TaxID=51031 RepID=A0ABR1D3I7_NECAM
MILYLFLFSYVQSILAGPGLISSKDVIDKSMPETETVLTDEDFRSFTSQRDITKIGIKVKDDPTMGNKMEGDIAMENLKKFVEDNNKLGRNAIRQAYRRWPNGEIPYTLSSQYGAYSRSVIAKAMQEYHDKTCVRFVPRDVSRHVDYIYIHPDDGCYSLVGKTGGRQPLSLDSGCIQVGTIVHELMHAVGFFHEQSRQDRDEYIEIVWRNVQNGADDQFEKTPAMTIIGDVAFGRCSLTATTTKRSNILFVLFPVEHVYQESTGIKERIDAVNLAQRITSSDGYNVDVLRRPGLIAQRDYAKVDDSKKINFCLLL